MNVQEFESSLREDGFAEVLTRQQPPGYFLGDHRHAFDARALIIDGDITLTVNGAARIYPQRTVFELPAGTLHQEQAGPVGVTYSISKSSVHFVGFANRTFVLPALRLRVHE
jgi:quercetin dioxygenase-like cupin family protein